MKGIKLQNLTSPEPNSRSGQNRRKASPNLSAKGRVSDFATILGENSLPSPGLAARSNRVRMNQQVMNPENSTGEYRPLSTNAPALAATQKRNPGEKQNPIVPGEREVNRQPDVTPDRQPRSNSNNDRTSTIRQPGERQQAESRTLSTQAPARAATREHNPGETQNSIEPEPKAIHRQAPVESGREPQTDAGNEKVSTVGQTGERQQAESRTLSTQAPARAATREHNPGETQNSIEPEPKAIHRQSSVISGREPQSNLNNDETLTIRQPGEKLKAGKVHRQIAVEGSTPKIFKASQGFYFIAGHPSNRKFSLPKLLHKFTSQASPAKIQWTPVRTRGCQLGTVNNTVDIQIHHRIVHDFVYAAKQVPSPSISTDRSPTAAIPSQPGGVARPAEMGWQTISGLPGKPLELTQGSETRQTPRLTVTFEMMRHEQQLSSQLSSSAGQGESQGSILGAGKGNPSNTNEETNVPTPEQSSAKAREEEQNKAVKSDQTNNKEAAASSNARKPSPAGEDKRTPAPGQKIENLQQRQAEFVRHIAAKTPHRPGLNVQAVQNLKNLAEKIRAKAQLLKGNGVTVLEARLSPAKLGTVRIQIEISGDQMRLILAAERPEAAAALQNARSDLAALVSDHGYNLTRCDVEDRYPQSRGSEMHPQGGTNRRGYRGQFEDESESSGQEDGQHPRRMIDWGYNTMELVA